MKINPGKTCTASMQLSTSVMLEDGGHHPCCHVCIQTHLQYACFKGISGLSELKMMMKITLQMRNCGKNSLEEPIAAT